MPIVKLYANLRKLAGTKELSIAGATVGAVVGLALVLGVLYYFFYVMGRSGEDSLTAPFNKV